MRIILIVGSLLVSSAAGVLAGQKLVIAHYMTDMVPQGDGRLNRWLDPGLESPVGSTAAMGGISQTVPMVSLHSKGMNLTEAVDFEIRAARQLGVDGFQFYYPLLDNVPALERRYNAIIREFIRLCDTRYPGFRVSVCLSHPKSAKALTEKGRIALWSAPVRKLLEETRNSPAWLRSKSGALLFYLWMGDGMAGGVKLIANSPREVRKGGRAYERFSEAVGKRIEFVFQVHAGKIEPAYVDSVVETFPAVWGWTASEENTESWDALAKRCGESGCMYTQSVYPDYYTSKLYPKGDTEHRILSTKEALAAGFGGVERHYRVTDLGRTQIALLRRAVDLEVPIINYITWNDYPEGHHLAPEKSHNFGPAMVLRHFKQEWKSGEQKVERDEAVVFFKRYRHDAAPKYGVHLKVVSERKDLEAEDRIELVTLLTERAEVFLNEEPLGFVEAGLRVHSIPSEPGSVRVLIERGGEEVLFFETPEKITEAPLRTDRLTYSYSSGYEREFGKLFGK